MVVSRLSFCSGREGERRACEGGGIGFRPRARRLRARSGASGGVGGARGAVEQRDARADGLNGWDVAGDATERFAWLTASLPECKDCRDLSRDFDLDKVAGVAAASAIVLESGLSFLGVGVQPPSPSWGVMLNDHFGYIVMDAAYLAILPGLAIMFMVLAFNMLGNGLRDALDVRMK